MRARVGSMTGKARGMVWRGISARGLFFFSSRRRHTRFDCDWSSDVCSSDLAVELRNAELFTASHGEVLRRHGVAHVFNSWTEMPPIGTQLDLPWTLGGAGGAGGGGAGFTVARALMKPGRKYAEAVRRFEPYDQGREPQPEMRRGALRPVAG